MSIGLLPGETEIGPPMTRRGPGIMVRCRATRLPIQIIEPQDHQIGKFRLVVIGKKGQPSPGRAAVQSGKQSVNSPARIIRHGLEASTIPFDKIHNRQRFKPQILSGGNVTMHPVSLVDVGAG